MATTKTLYKCRDCGCPTYQSVMGRGHNGALQATGQYRCCGCRNVFANIREWWQPKPAPEAPVHQNTFG
jgi:hypothetical protein